MGATSVTGKGNGTADAGVKGPQNNRNHFVPQLSPHVVAAGEVALVAGSATITLPDLSDAATNYIVMTEVLGSANTSYADNKTDTSGVMTSFDITGTGTDTVQWAVIRKGI